MWSFLNNTISRCAATFGLAALLLLAFARCGENKEENILVPPNILSEEAFARLLTDFSLAESASNMNVLNLSIKQADSAYTFNPLSDNKVRQGQYDSTVAFYIKNPVMYKRVYENVLAALAQIQSQREGAKTKKDSR